MENFAGNLVLRSANSAARTAGKVAFSHFVSIAQGVGGLLLTGTMPNVDLAAPITYGMAPATFLLMFIALCRECWLQLESYGI